MKPNHFAPKALALLGLGATTLLGGCWEKDRCTPKGSTCDTAAVVVDLSQTTGCGLALHLADSSYVIPTGSTWTNFHAKVGDQVTVGYTVKDKQCGNGSSTAACPAGKQVELGCITLVTPAPTTTTTPTTTTGTGAN